MDNRCEGECAKRELKALVRQHQFEYHSVDLGHGVQTPGRDRSGTLDIVFPDSLEEKSVLDAGCAIGYFCFEAEARGAKRVIGLEVKETRYRQALLLKEVLNSKVEFRQQDALQLSASEAADYVLLLNVLHHAPQPMRLLYHLIPLTREVLIIEFPTFSDPKFRTMHRYAMPWLCNRLPFVGVSSLRRRDIDQTFVFSPVALRRILTDHTDAFSDVSFEDSPIEGRKIAFCKK